MSEDTIAAVATAPGESAVSLIRMSGRGAIAVADRVFRGRIQPSKARNRSVLFGEITASDGSLIDEVLLTVMRGPHSVTGEDVIEISCHGGMTAPRLVLRRLLEAGARLAEPGEFTRRAFVNGKIDLVQAEAVCDIVRAANETAHKLALRQLRGGLSEKLRQIESILFDGLVWLEAEIDFPEEELGECDRQNLIQNIDTACNELESLLATEEAGRYIRSGIEVAIVGRPNVGKSSLFNRLIGKDRVIVSPLPGTTRDTVDARLNLNGFCLSLHDTAGLGASNDLIEQEAVRRAQVSLRRCDVALVVIDVSEPLTLADWDILEQAAEKCHVVVVNKIDLPLKADLGRLRRPIRVSALKGYGVEDLLEELKRVAREQAGDLDLEIVVSERHATCIRQALDAIERAKGALVGGASPELVAADLRWALEYLGEVTGENVASQLLDEIFARFCIGK